MPERFPEAIYGKCPIGHNPQPSGETADDISTTQIPEGEGRRLYWSDYFQDYVCAVCLRITKEDQIADAKKHEEWNMIEKKMAAMGIQKNS